MTREEFDASEKYGQMDHEELQDALFKALNEIEAGHRAEADFQQALLKAGKEAKIRRDAVEALLAVLPATGDPALHREGCGEESEQPELCDCGVEAERLAVVEKVFQLDEPPF